MKNGLLTACKVIALGLSGAVVASGVGSIVNADAAEASSGHRFPNPGGGKACHGWVSFAPPTALPNDWGASGIHVKYVSCRFARSAVKHYGQHGPAGLPWSNERRGHAKGLGHYDVRLRQGRAVIVFQSY